MLVIITLSGCFDHQTFSAIVYFHNVSKALSGKLSTWEISAFSFFFFIYRTHASIETCTLCIHFLRVKSIFVFAISMPLIFAI